MDAYNLQKQKINDYIINNHPEKFLIDLTNNINSCNAFDKKILNKLKADNTETQNTVFILNLSKLSNNVNKYILKKYD